MSNDPVTLDNCASEPIHIPGAIQPHGVFFACRLPDLVVVQVSQNVTSFFGHGPQAVLGRPLHEMFDGPSGSALEALVREEDLRSANPFRLIGLDEAVFDAVAHRSGGAFVVEVEPGPRGRTAQIGSFDPRLRSIVMRLHGAHDVASLCRVAAEEVRRLTGFDRVMVYRFDAEWNGEVVAEDKREDLGAFLGLRYPASDIPAQARRLYTVNRLRLIADVKYQPVPLVPPLDPASGAPIDMSESVLRSVSPIHVEYLTNMGVSASMSVSLLVDGELAGLIACHHYSGPRRVPIAVRDTAEYLGSALSWQLRTLADAGRSARVREVHEHEAEVVRSVAVADELLEGLHTPALLALTGARGAAVVLAEGVRRLGETPTMPDILAIVARLREEKAEIHATDRLASLLPGAESFEDRAAGLLAVAVSRELGEYVLWFRPAITRVVNWAGNPTKDAVVDAAGVPRLSPRGSFELWKETVKGRSEPWESWQVDAASSLRRILLGGVRQRAVQLRSVNQRLLDADRQKDDFIATVSHELRTPMNAISGWASLLRSGGVAPERLPQAIEVIQRNAQLQAQLIEDLLDVSRITAGNLALEIEELDLGSVIEATVASAALAAEAKKLRVAFEMDAAATRVRGDVTRLRQVVTNLLTNAIKFTPKGGNVDVKLARVESDVELRVSDTGRGIDPTFLPHVFDPFRQEQGEAGGKHRAVGLGLGLAIAKKLVEMHGGQIWAESPGRDAGAIFYVRLPVAPLQRVPVEEKTPPPLVPPARTLEARLVLVVDDHEDAREMLKTILESAGASVVTADSATTALDLLEARRFDLLVSDVGMPELDGLSFLRTLRERSKERGGQTPAVALTAYARAADRIAALEAGFQAHVPKPVHHDELIATLRGILSR